MFISVQRMEEAAFSADHLTNPVNVANPMILGFYRNFSSTIFFTAYTKKAAPIFWDGQTNKQISRRKWTAEMVQFADQKSREVRPAPYTIKMTIVAYLFILAFFGFFAYLVYDTVRPKPDVMNQVTVLMETPKVGDTYFGRFETMKPGERVASKLGFGWFKVLSVNGSNLEIAMSKEMSAGHKPSDQLNSTDFESTSIPAQINKQEAYELKLLSTDQLTEMYFTEKK